MTGNNGNAILKWWQVIVAVIGLVATFVGLMGSVNANTDNMAALAVRERANKLVFADFSEEVTAKLNLLILNQAIMANELDIEIEKLY